MTNATRTTCFFFLLITISEAAQAACVLSMTCERYAICLLRYHCLALRLHAHRDRGLFVNFIADLDWLGRFV